MKKFLVVSDAHSDAFTLDMILRKTRDLDGVFALGDMVGAYDQLLVKSNYKMYGLVKGNCDGYMCKYPTNKIVKIENTNVFLTHGSIEGVKNGLGNLCEKAKLSECTVALFGHTHSQYSATRDGVLLCNPGAAMHGNYGVLTVDGTTAKFETMQISD